MKSWSRSRLRIARAGDADPGSLEGGGEEEELLSFRIIPSASRRCLTAALRLPYANLTAFSAFFKVKALFLGKYFNAKTAKAAKIPKNIRALRVEKYLGRKPCSFMKQMAKLHYN
jgi:hypothetical protein